MISPDSELSDRDSQAPKPAREGSEAGRGLPGWTYLASAPITLILVIGSNMLQASPLFSGWYLPFVASAVLVLWWGPRILPGCYLGSVVGAVIWGLPWQFALVAGLADVVVPALAYLLFRTLLKGDFRLSNLRSLTGFLVAADLLPVFAGVFLKVVALYMAGEIMPGRFWSLVADGWSASILAIQVTTIPALMYLSDYAARWGLCPAGSSDTASRLLPPELHTRGHYLAVLLIFGGVAGLAALIPIQAQSLVYGVFIVAAGLYFGISMAVASSIWTVLLTKFLPLASLHQVNSDVLWNTTGDLHFHLLLLCTVGLIVGRTSSDAREERLRRDRDRRALEDAQAYTRAVIDHSPIGISVRDRHGRLLLYNDAWLKIWDIWEDDLDDYCNRARTELTLDHRDSYLGEYQDEVARVYREGGRLVIPEVKIDSSRKGGTRWISQYFQAICNAEGKVDRVVVLTIDTTDRHQTERALRRSEEKYRTLWESIPLAMFRTMPSGRFLSVNPAMVKLFGFDCEQDLMKVLASDLYCDPADRVKAAAILQSEKSLLRYRTQFKRRDGSTFWGSSSVRATVDAQGEVLHFNGVLEDITSQMLAESAQRESEQRYRELVEHAQIAIIEDDIDGDFTFLNHKFAELLGYSISELSRMNVSQIVHPDDLTLVMQIHQDRYSGLEPITRYEFRAVRKDGSTVFLETSVTELRDGGKVVGSRSYLWDVTDRKRAEQSRRESEERYRHLVENATEGIVVVQGGRIVFVNPTAQRSSGYTYAELIGREVEELIVPEDRERSLSNYRRRLEPGAARRDATEVRIIHRNGQIAWYATSSCPIEWDGAPASLSFLTDITDRRRTLQALSESEEKFRLLSEQSFMGIMILQDGLIRYANEAAARVFDHDQVRVDGRQFRELLHRAHPADVAVAMKYSRSFPVDEGSTDHRSTYRVLTKSGQPRWIDQYCKPIDYGGARAIFVTLVDITERVDSMNRLTRLSAAVEQSANMISIVDIDGTVASVNPEYCKVTGYESHELVGHPCDMLGPPARLNKLYAEMWEAIGARQTWSGSVSSQRKNGDQFWKRLTVSPITDDNDDLIGCLTVGEDMTREMRTQQKLAEVEKLSAVGMLAAGVAHEFRNYLAGIIGNASFAREDLESSSDLSLACETLDQIIDIGEKANELTLSLLSFSRASAQNARPENLKELILNTLRLVKKEMRVRSVTLKTALEDVPPVDVMASKIQQLLINLLINAQQSIRGEGEVTVSLTADQAHAYVRVTDTGSGIPSENMVRVFDPFFSTKGVWGKDEQQGVGMGLAICRNVAREHGGELTVDSVVGEGTTFTLALPLQQTSADPKTQSESNRRFRVVCVSLNNSVLEKYLREAAVAEADLETEIPTSSGNESGPPDLVIYDARFAGKMELIRMAESCRRINVPYVLVNCSGLDYELDNLFDAARARFPELPRLTDLLPLIEVSAARSEALGESSST